MKHLFTARTTPRIPSIAIAGAGINPSLILALVNAARGLNHDHIVVIAEDKPTPPAGVEILTALPAPDLSHLLTLRRQRGAYASPFQHGWLSDK